LSDLRHIFIGWDAREQEAYEVCKSSILRHSSVPVEIIPIKESLLRRVGLYDRHWYINGDGQWVDSIDLRPFSTEFSFTRFFTPLLASLIGTHRWVLFCDCDFVFQSDVAELFRVASDRYAVMCTKHQHVPLEKRKMDDRAQTKYRRKNWSSCVLWNRFHPENRALTTEGINREPGLWLHTFSWLQDSLIGDIPLDWNFLVGYSHYDKTRPPKALHYTLGTPNMPGLENTVFSNVWWNELARLRGDNTGS
jgi:lipopolysaccharide biosynthesis glycosyltransferase